VARLALKNRLIITRVNAAGRQQKQASGHFLRIIGSSPFTFRYGSHMSEQTNAIREATSPPMTVKNPWNDSMVLSFPTQSRRVTPRSIW